MQRLRAAGRRRERERGGVEVGRDLDRGVRLALGDPAALVGGDQREAADAELAAGADDAQRDLAAAGDRHALEGRAHQSGSRRSRNAAMPSRPSSETRRSAIASAARVDCGAGSPSRRSGDQRLGGAHRRGAAAQHRGERALDGRVERLVVGVHLVHEADRACVRGVEQLAREEQRAGLRAADARERERGRSSRG